MISKKQFHLSISSIVEEDKIETISNSEEGYDKPIRSHLLATIIWEVAFTMTLLLDHNFLECLKRNIAFPSTSSLQWHIPWTCHPSYDVLVLMYMDNLRINLYFFFSQCTHPLTLLVEWDCTNCNLPQTLTIPWSSLRGFIASMTS